MAKRVHAVSLKGLLHNDNIVEEVNKDDVQYFDLVKIIEEFHGKNVSISIKEETNVESKGE